jgi:hypothetical protein
LRDPPTQAYPLAAMVLFAVPPALILAAWGRGCRRSERPAVAACAALTTIAALPALVWALLTPGELAHAIAYALVTISTACLAMLIRRRPDRDDGRGRDEDDAPSPAGDDDDPPIDWDDFERRFWEDVRRRERDRPPRERVPV